MAAWFWSRTVEVVSLNSVEHRRRVRLGRVGWKSRLSYPEILTRILWRMSSGPRRLLSIVHVTPRDSTHPRSFQDLSKEMDHQPRPTLILSLLPITLNERRRTTSPERVRETKNHYFCPTARISNLKYRLVTIQPEKVIEAQRCAG